MASADPAHVPPLPGQWVIHLSVRNIHPEHLFKIQIPVPFSLEMVIHRFGDGSRRLSIY